MQMRQTSVLAAVSNQPRTEKKDAFLSSYGEDSPLLPFLSRVTLCLASKQKASKQANKPRNVGYLMLSSL
jgi:hypothetical protein